MIKPMILHIQGLPLAVNIVDYPRVSESDSSNWGMYKAGEQEILIQSSLSEERKEETLLHEILHAVSYELGLNLSEHQVECLASGLYSVYKNSNLKLTFPKDITHD